MHPSPANQPDHSYVYSVIATTFILFSVKEKVLLRLFLICRPPCFTSTSTNTLSTVLNLISEIVLVQAIAWTTVYYLTSSSALRTAFMGSMCNGETLLLLSVYMGYMSYQFYVALCVRGDPWLTAHSLILNVCAILFVKLSPASFPVIALIGVCCEAGHFKKPVQELLEVMEVGIYHRLTLIAHGCGAILTLIARLLIPTVAMSLAVVHAANLNQLQHSTNSHLALFTFYLTYLATVNIFLTVTSFYTFRETFYLRRFHLAAQCLVNKTKKLSTVQQITLLPI